MVLRRFINRTGKKTAEFLFRRMARFSALGSADLKGESEDESLLSARLPSWNAAAEDYFRRQSACAEHDSRKPWLPDASSGRLIAKLGWVLSELVFGEHLVVLDFGCGLGWLSRLLHRLEFNVFGLDVSPTALEYAAGEALRDPLPGSPHFQRFLPYDGRAFPLPDAAVHFIISFDAFHHVPNQGDVLKEMHRVLTPGGKLILSEPGIGHSAEASTAEDVTNFGVLEREVRIPDFEKKARAAGFEEIYLKPCPVHTDEKWPLGRCRDFFGGVIGPDDFLGLRRSMISNPMFVCQKKGDLRSSYHHRALIEAGVEGLRAGPGEPLEIPCVLRNSGALAFLSGEHPPGGFVTIAVRVFEEGANLSRETDGRMLLEKDAAPGSEARFIVRLSAPSRPGHFRIVIEPVYERFYWFREKGTKPAEITLVVE